MKHFSYPSIEQFRNAIRNVKYNVRYIGKEEDGSPKFNGLLPLPKIKYRGTVKLHGTNSGIALQLTTGEMQFQSREQIITPEKDNAGCAAFLSKVDLKALFDLIPKSDVRAILPPDNGDGNVENTEEDLDCAIIYGEFCGGNIQKTVALNQLPKMFVVFSIKYRGIWLSDDVVKNVKLPEQGIYNILDYPCVDVEIDFENPELISNDLRTACLAVEEECPVAKAFGVSGIGEGLVFKPIDPNFNSSRFWFKVKGEKHSASKVKTLAAVDVEKVKSMNEFIDKVVTDNRLAQGVETLKRNGVSEIEPKHIGDFIRWVFNDVVKEESDTMLASGLQEKDIGGPLATKAKKWLFANYLSVK